MENSSGLMLAAKIIKARSQKEKVSRDLIFISGRNDSVRLQRRGTGCNLAGELQKGE